MHDVRVEAAQRATEGTDLAKQVCSRFARGGPRDHLDACGDHLARKGAGRWAGNRNALSATMLVHRQCEHHLGHTGFDGLRDVENAPLSHGACETPPRLFPQRHRPIGEALT